MTLVQALSLCVLLTSDIRQNILHKFTEPSMEPPRWCTPVEHQHGGRKIV